MALIIVPDRQHGGFEWKITVRGKVVAGGRTITRAEARTEGRRREAGLSRRKSSRRG